MNSSLQVALIWNHAIRYPLKQNTSQKDFAIINLQVFTTLNFKTWFILMGYPYWLKCYIKPKPYRMKSKLFVHSFIAFLNISIEIQTNYIHHVTKANTSLISMLNPIVQPRLGSHSLTIPFNTLLFWHPTEPPPLVGKNQYPLSTSDPSLPPNSTPSIHSPLLASPIN